MKLETRGRKLGATLPTYNSKLYNILEWLYIGETVTVQQALFWFKTTELRKHVSRLVDYGWPIRGEWITENGDRFKRYYYER